MAELTTLARPYAKAAFECARQDKAVASWSSALALAASVSQQMNVQRLFALPELTAQQKSARFVELFGDKLNVKQSNFIGILAENKRLSLLPQVQALFELLKAEYEKAIEVDVRTAFEIAPDMQQKLAQTLSKKLDRAVSLHTSVDQSLLGGALIRAGDMVIDGSIRGRLSKLADVMSA